MIVEDEEKLARFIELELCHEGYGVEKAFDGRSGLEMAESGHFDLILLDIMLPGMSGMEQNFGSDSTQGSLMMNLTDNQSGEITLEDADGNTLVSYTPMRE